MARGRTTAPLAAVLAGLCVSAHVAGFAVTVRPGRSSALGQLEAAAASRTSAQGSSPKVFGELLGDKVASVIVNSPLYPFLAEQAKDTMKKSAQNIGVDWDGEVANLREAMDWDTALSNLLESSSTEAPEYYKRKFHTYPEGNLCWEAAWEQHLASKAVGVRNFPNDALNGEHLLRTAYEKQMERLGVVVDDGGLVVDFGCGSGTSTRYLAKQFPSAGKVVGFDLSPHMVLTGQFMSAQDEDVDSRVELVYADAAKTGLADGSASLVSLSLLVHELSADGRREVFAEAARILRPGGSLSIMEMDPSAPGYVKLRNNPLLFSILRSTEPYLDVYFAEAKNIDAELQGAGFSTVRKSGATGRHMTVVAVKAGSFDLRGSDDERERADTHVSSHRAGVWINNPIQKEED